MRKSEIYYYKSCDTLPIYNFYKILNTKDLKWLIKDYNEDDEYDTDEEKLIEFWEKVYDGYIDLLGEKAITKKSLIVNQISKLELEIHTVSTLLKIYVDKPFKEIAEQIDEWGYYKNDIEKSIKKLESLKFKIDILKSKNDIGNEEEEDFKYDLYNDIVSIETSLGNGLNIDPHKTVVSKWVSYILISEKRNAKRSD